MDVFKIMILGNSSVEKSSLLIRYCDDTFRDITIGVDFRFKTIKLDRQGIKLQIQDTTDQERFRNITNSYYKYINIYRQGIIIVYDITNVKSFEDVIKYWMVELSYYADQNVKLLRNKQNRYDNRRDQEMTIQLSKEFNMQHYVVSAKIAEQVQLAIFSRLKIYLLIWQDLYIQ